MLAQGGVTGLIVMIAALVTFFIQLWYYMRVYGRIPSLRDRRRENEGEPGGVSVIIPLRDTDYGFIEETLPLIMGQNYDEFEVVLMDLADDPDFSFTLGMLSEHNPKIKIVKLTGAPMKKMSNKMLLNVGIKGAKYENMVFTTSACRPVSERWLTAMARGFLRGDIVLGYCGLDPQMKNGRRWARMERVAWSARWLGAALRGRAYRGTICNIGFTKTAYFGNNGFNHLNMNIGEDDLFVQKMKRNSKVSVVSAGKSSVRQTMWGGWYKDKKLASATFPFYPLGVRAYIGGELWSRAFFFASVVVLIIIMPLKFKIAAGGLLILRFVLVSWEMSRVCRRLSEKGLGAAYLIYDLAAPVFEAWLAVSRRIRKPEGLWR